MSPLTRFSLSALAAVLFALPARATEIATVVEGFSHPESVACDTTHCYVSNLGAELKPTERHGDGFISRLAHDGTVIDRRFITGLNAPKGLLVLDGFLYAATVGHVEGFSLADGTPVFDIDFATEGALFINGLAAGPEGTLYVSATDKGKIYAVDVKKRNVTPLPSSVPGANGLAYDAATGKLYVVGHEIGVIETKAKGAPYRPLADYRGGLDGAFLDGKGALIVSDWVSMGTTGLLLAYHVADGTLSSMGLPQTVGGPADIALNRADGTIWIPAMLEGKVMIVRP